MSFFRRNKIRRRISISSDNQRPILYLVVVVNFIQWESAEIIRWVIIKQENVFRVCIAWYKHERGWENSRQLCKPETSSRVCITVSNSPNPCRVYIRLCKHRKKVFYCFYKKTSSKNYKKKIILLMNTYLPTTLIWRWHFSTDQSKLIFLKIWWSTMWRVQL